VYKEMGKAWEEEVYLSTRCFFLSPSVSCNATPNLSALFCFRSTSDSCVMSTSSVAGTARTVAAATSVAGVDSDGTAVASGVVAAATGIVGVTGGLDIAAGLGAACLGAGLAAGLAAAFAVAAGAAGVAGVVAVGASVEGAGGVVVAGVVDAGVISGLVVVGLVCASGLACPRAPASRATKSGLLPLISNFLEESSVRSSVTFILARSNCGALIGDCEEHTASRNAKKKQKCWCDTQNSFASEQTAHKRRIK
jgi:hypothetical protein